MKDKFIKAYTENITRPGADKLDVYKRQEVERQYREELRQRRLARQRRRASRR